MKKLILPENITMLKICGIVSLIFLVGCSTNSPRIDVECNKIASYAYGVTQWKLIGASVEDTSAVSINPIILTFQQAYIRDRVYKSNFLDPSRAYNRFYNECVMYGYTNTMQIYEELMLSNIKRKNINESSINVSD